MKVTSIGAIDRSNTIPGRWEALWQGCQHLLPEPDHNMTILAWAV